MIKITDLSAGYDDKPVISHLSLWIERKKITTIIGPNGSGKSTLLKCIARQMKPMGGGLSIMGQPIEEFTPKAFAQQVCYLKQSRDVPLTTVESLVLHGRFPYLGFPRKLTAQDREIAKNAMKQTGVWHLRHQELSALSGGECQKVYLAMTLAQKAPILLLDEPTTYLDIRHQLELLRLLSNLKDQGQTIVTVLHDINSALALSDCICVLDRGNLAFCGTPQDLVHSNIIDRVFGIKTKPATVDGEKPLLLFEI